MDEASPFLASAITAAARIEERLRDLGGEGNGLAELAASLRPRLRPDLRDRIRKVASVRNAFAHEPYYDYDGDEGQFLELCESILSELGARDSASERTSPSRKRGGSMDTNDWVEVDLENIRGKKFRSSRDRRLVFFRGGGVEVKPIGDHWVPLAWGTPDAIGIVNLFAREVAVEPDGELPTQDGVLLRVKAIAHIAVADNDTAISRVALDAPHQEKVVRNTLLKAVQKSIASSDYEDVRTAWEPLAEAVVGAMHLASGVSFRVTDVVFLELKASDASLHAYAQEKMKAETRKLQHEIALAEAKAALEVAALTAEFARREKQADAQDRLDYLEKLTALMGTDAGMAAANPEVYKAVKIAQAKQLAEAARIQAHVAWEQGLLTGQNAMAKKILPQIINVNNGPDTSNPYGVPAEPVEKARMADESDEETDKA